MLYRTYPPSVSLCRTHGLEYRCLEVHILLPTQGVSAHLEGMVGDDYLRRILRQRQGTQEGKKMPK